MNEKTIVADALNSVNNGLKSLGDMISQTENQQLRQTLIQMRNETETCQYELFTLAKTKGYYHPAEKAREDEIQSIKSIVSQLSMGSQGQSTQGVGTQGRMQ
nr:spore coat protein [Anaeromicropila herbilytica]